MAKKKEPEKEANHERWLVSYADFITLLFAFFVVMFATSNSSKEKREEFARSVTNAFSNPFGIAPGGLGASVNTLPGAGDQGALQGDNPWNMGGEAILIEQEPDDDAVWEDMTSEEPDDYDEFPDLGPEEQESGVEADLAGDLPYEVATPSPEESVGSEGSPELQALYEDLKTMIEDIGIQGIHVQPEKRGIVISLSETGFFDSGEAELKPSSVATVDNVAHQIKRALHNRTGIFLRVEGHTDDVPLASTVRYRDNMDLSNARANTVRRHLVEQHGFLPEKVGTSGYGPFRPIAENSSSEGRARNRRVDIVILNDEAVAYEPHGAV